jgi:hypothetical protein
LHSLRTSDKRATADVAAATKFPEKLMIIIKGGYLPNQIFSVNGLGIFWEKTPSHMFIYKEKKKAPGFKVSQDHLTLLLGGNVEGDIKAKPLLTHISLAKPMSSKRMAQNITTMI